MSHHQSAFIYKIKFNFRAKKPTTKIKVKVNIIHFNCSSSESFTSNVVTLKHLKVNFQVKLFRIHFTSKGPAFSSLERSNVVERM